MPYEYSPKITLMQITENKPCIIRIPPSFLKAHNNNQFSYQYSFFQISSDFVLTAFDLVKGK